MDGIGHQTGIKLAEIVKLFSLIVSGQFTSADDLMLQPRAKCFLEKVQLFHSTARSMQQREPRGWVQFSNLQSRLLLQGWEFLSSRRPKRASMLMPRFLLEQLLPLLLVPQKTNGIRRCYPKLRPVRYVQSCPTDSIKF